MSLRSTLYRYLGTWLDSSDYERISHKTDSVYCLARKALIEKMLKYHTNPRVLDGILSQAYEWDFIPGKYQDMVVQNLFQYAAYWGGDNEIVAAKLMVFDMLREVSPNLTADMILQNPHAVLQHPPVKPIRFFDPTVRVWSH